MSSPTPQLNATSCEICEVQYLLADLPCDRCATPAQRFSTAERVAIDLALDHPVLLLVRVSVHYCLPCHHYFRAQPPFLRPDGIYTHRVVQAAVRSVYHDGMAMRRVPIRLARDFWVQPSEGTIRRWCRAYHAAFNFVTEYQPWVIASFSGVLCVDEVYQGDLALLLAVDPAAPDGDRLIGYQLVNGDVGAPTIEGFLQQLKDLGVQPDQVITDGSSLYPAVLAKIWPSAAHQLCLFHETRRITKAVLTVIQELRRTLPTPPAKQGNTHWGGRLCPSPPTTNPNDPETQRWQARQTRRQTGIAAVHRLAQQGLSYSAIARQLRLNRRTVRAWHALVPPAAEQITLEPDWYDHQMPLPATLRQQERAATVATIRDLAHQGLSYSAIARQVKLHRVTVSTWLKEAGAEPLEDPPAGMPTQDTPRSAAMPPAPWDDWATVRQVREGLQDDRFLFLRRPDHLTPDERQRMQVVLESPIGIPMRAARNFLEDWYAIWRDDDGQRRTVADARMRYAQWSSKDYGGLLALRRVQDRVTSAQFEKLSHFLRNPRWEATNNGAERGGRAFRHLQGPHYTLRSEESIRGAIEMHAQQQQARARGAPQRGSQSSRGRKPRLVSSQASAA